MALPCSSQGRDENHVHVHTSRSMLTRDMALLRERYDQQPHTPVSFEEVGVTVRVGAYRAGGPVAYGNRPDTAADRNARYSAHGRLNRADRQKAWMLQRSYVTSIAWTRR